MPLGYQCNILPENRIKFKPFPPMKMSHFLINVKRSGQKEEFFHNALRMGSRPGPGERPEGENKGKNSGRGRCLPVASVYRTTEPKARQWLPLRRVRPPWKKDPAWGGAPSPRRPFGMEPHSLVAVGRDAPARHVLGLSVIPYLAAGASPGPTKWYNLLLLS